MSRIHSHFSIRDHHYAQCIKKKQLGFNSKHLSEITRQWSNFCANIFHLSQHSCCNQHVFFSGHMFRLSGVRNHFPVTYAHFGPHIPDVGFIFTRNARQSQAILFKF